MVLLYFLFIIWLRSDESAACEINENNAIVEDLDDLPSGDQVPVTRSGQLPAAAMSDRLLERRNNPRRRKSLRHSTATVVTLPEIKQSLYDDYFRENIVSSVLRFVKDASALRATFNAQKEKIGHAKNKLLRMSLGYEFRKSQMTQISLSCRILTGINTYAEFMLSVVTESNYKTLFTVAQDFLDEKPSAGELKPSDSIKDNLIELEACDVVNLQLTNFDKEHSDFKTLIDTELQSQLELCETFKSEESVGSNILTDLSIEIRKKFESLLNGFFEDEGTIFDKYFYEPHFARFVHLENNVKRLHGISSRMLSLLPKNTHVKNLLVDSNNLQYELKGMLKTHKELLIEINIFAKPATAFVKFAPTVIEYAESLGFFAPLQVLVLHYLKNGMWSIETMRNNVESQIEQLKRYTND